MIKYVNSHLEPVSSGNSSKMLEIIEKALGLVGGESKSVILNYVKDRYGMNPDLLATYKDEFANYLREVLGDSADIIAARINQAIEEHTNSNNNPDNPLCYICNQYFLPEKMRQHLMHGHTKEEIAYHLAVVYVDDWHEEAELREGNNSTLQQLLHN